jgi:thioredoxin reductase (NADPH)
MAEYASKLLIIGSGPAGYTAGIYAARAGLDPILVSGQQQGGQLTLSGDVENFPGFAEPISGLWLMDNMRRQVERFGVRQIDDVVTEVDFHAFPFICSSEKGNSFRSQAVIIATGSSARWLDLESEKKYIGFGVSTCATCDGFFYRDKPVAVIGGGNSAAEEALYLTNFASKVFLIHRRDQLRSDMFLQQRLKNHPKIHILWNTVTQAVEGTDNPPEVTGLVLKNVQTDKTERIAVSGVFISIGPQPNTAVFKEYLDLDREGYIRTKPDCAQTNISGIFAAGDVKDPIFRQAVIAAGSGAVAAMEAEKYLTNLNESSHHPSTARSVPNPFKKPKSTL